MSSSRTSSALVAALVAAEDWRYYRHCGVDFLSVVRVLLLAPIHGRLHGASTIEQQLVRTITARYERTVRRKAREMVLAVLVSERFSKNVLGGVYLSLAYFGWRMNGAEEAAARLGVDLGALSRTDAARIVARLKYPEPQHPSLRRSANIHRRERHIERLLAWREGTERTAS